MDTEKEIARLTVELEKAQSELDRAKGKLANAGFVAKAPKSLIDSEKEKIAGYEKLVEGLAKKIEQLK